MAWFRLYTELVHDPKVQRLSAEDFKTWINLLCCAKEADKGGQLPSIEALAYRLRKRSDHTAAVLRRLSAAMLLDTTSDKERVRYWIHGWSARQFVSDNSTPRVLKHRSRNVSETPRARADTDTDTDTEQSRAEAEAEAERPPPLAFRLYEQTIGTIDAYVAQRIEEEVDAGWTEECQTHCFNEASALNKRNWRYVAAIRKRHAAEGCFAPKPSKAAQRLRGERTPEEIEADPSNLAAVKRFLGRPA